MICCSSCFLATPFFSSSLDLHDAIAVRVTPGLQCGPGTSLEEAQASCDGQSRCMKCERSLKCRIPSSGRGVGGVHRVDVRRGPSVFHSMESHTLYPANRGATIAQPPGRMLYLTADSPRTGASPAGILARFQLSRGIYRHCRECFASAKHAAIPVEPSWPVAEVGGCLLCSAHFDSVGGLLPSSRLLPTTDDNVEVEI